MWVLSLIQPGFLGRAEGKGLVCDWVPQVAVMGHWAIGGFVSLWVEFNTGEHLVRCIDRNLATLLGTTSDRIGDGEGDGGLVLEMRLDYRGGDLVMTEEVERGVRCVMDVDCEVRRRVKEMSVKSREALMEGGSAFASLEHLIEDMMDTN